MYVCMYVCIRFCSDTMRCPRFVVAERLNMLWTASVFESMWESRLCACNQPMTVRLLPSKSSVTISVTMSNAFSANPTACMPLHTQYSEANKRYIHTYTYTYMHTYTIHIHSRFTHQRCPDIQTAYS